MQFQFLAVIILSSLVYSCKSTSRLPSDADNKLSTSDWRNGDVRFGYLKDQLSDKTCLGSQEAFRACMDSLALTIANFLPNYRLGVVQQSQDDFVELANDNTIAIVLQPVTDQSTGIAPFDLEARSKRFAIWDDAFAKISENPGGLFRKKISWKDIHKATEKIIPQTLESDFTVYYANQWLYYGDDPHARLIPTAGFFTSPDIAGVGIRMEFVSGGVLVIEAFEEVGAYKAGVRAGDLIIKIDNTLTKGLPQKKVTDLLLGKPSTSVNLTIQRQTDEFTTTVERSNFQPPVLSQKIFSGTDGSKYGYLKVREFKFQKQDLEEIYANLFAQGIDGLILDVRGNPGGSPFGAINLLEPFSPYNETIFKVHDLESNQVTKSYTSTKNDSFQGQLVVLIDEFSASAAELTAGYLKEKDRAIIVGRLSFGKGTIQSSSFVQSRHVKENTVAKLNTVGTYHFPSGATPQRFGITPHFVVERTGAEQIWREGDLFPRTVERPAVNVEPSASFTQKIQELQPCVKDSQQKLVDDDDSLNVALQLLGC